MFTSFNHLSQSATASYLLSPCANYYLARARYSKSHMRDSNCRVREVKSYFRDKNKKPPGLCTKVYHDDRQAVWYNLNPKLYLFPYSLIRYIMCKSEAGLVWLKKKKKKLAICLCWLQECDSSPQFGSGSIYSLAVMKTIPSSHRGGDMVWKSDMLHSVWGLH